MVCCNTVFVIRFKSRQQPLGTCLIIIYIDCSFSGLLYVINHESWKWIYPLLPDAILNKIPENERSSVYNYETSSQWLLSGLEPYDKYCITADHFSMLSNEIFQHIQNLFEHREPMYIVTGRNVQIQNQIVQTYLEKDYTELYTNNIYTLYQKIP